MDIPIVQGTEVPNGAFSHGIHEQTPYVVAAEGNVASFQNKQQPPQFRDAIWAVLFVVHLALMLVLIVRNASSLENGGNGGYGGVLWLVGIIATFSIFISAASLSMMMKYPLELVKSALIFSVGMSLLVAILGFLTGQLWMGIGGLFMFAIGVCYARAVWDRIPFAAANLNTALTAVRANMGLTLVAIVMLIVAIVWTELWFVGLGQALASQSGIVVFFLLVSFYWFHQVLVNIVHVTSAGTIATWWYVPIEAAGWWSTAIQDSLVRSVTYSFGSICFGSLLVAVVQALRTLAHMARDNEDGKILACILECILALLQDVIEYLNKWAYVYVGIYGFSYLEAGKNVIELFQQKGWSVIISDDLCDRVLFMVSIGVGVITGIIGWALAAANASFVVAIDGSGSGGTGFLIGFVVGFAFSSVILSVVGSAVNTVIVCYAEAPAEFEVNYPDLSALMRNAWSQAWPGVIG